jgi:hypothetical protein
MTFIRPKKETTTFDLGVSAIFPSFTLVNIKIPVRAMSMSAARAPFAGSYEIL